MTDRSKIIEVMAQRRVDGLLISCDHPHCECDFECERRHHSLVREREEAERDLDALQAEGMAVVPGWQPIETKPRDHFPVLVWSERLGQVVAFLDVTWAWWPCPAIEPLSSAPTHWRPLLPASPYGKAVVKEKDDE